MADNENPSSGRGLNPFARRDDHSPQHLIVLRVLTLASYLLLLVTAIYYTFAAPTHGHKIWHNNTASPFTQNSLLTSLYWLLLFALHPVFLAALYNTDSSSSVAANLASHTVASNLLLFAFLHLWTRSHFLLAEAVLVVNFFNLSAAYFRHSTAPRWIHVAIVSGPLAWNFVALYWVGARAVHAHGLAARIVGNVFIWGFAAYGVFFLAAYKDYTMGFALSILAFSTAVGQFLTKLPVLQLQWIFAFAIAGLLFVLSLAVGVPGLIGRDPFPRGEIVSEERERAPLLTDE